MLGNLALIAVIIATTLSVTNGRLYFFQFFWNPLQKYECNLHTYSLLFVRKMYANISMYTRYSNFGPNVYILMFANCMQTVEYILMFANHMQTVEYIPLYAICLHAHANCIYTVHMQVLVNSTHQIFNTYKSLT